MKRLPLALLLSLSTIIAQAQVQWPSVTQTMKPWARWWWQGSAVDKENLAALLKQYHDAGLGGLEVTPIYGVKGEEQKFIPFLSPKWVDMFTFTLQEARRLDLGIDMATGTGWPFGGPWVTPEDACKNIQLKTYTLQQGESLKETIRFVQEPLVKTVSGKNVDISTLSYPIATNKNLQAYAFDQVRYEKQLPLQVLMAYSDQGAAIDLTGKVDAAGKLHWKAPQGTWSLYALFMGWHGKLVERAAPGGEGDAIDHFSLKALKHYLYAFDTAFAGKDISYLRSYFNDSYEVDDAKGQSNWTPAFFNEFEKRRGYDLRLHLPALYQKEDTDKNARVRYDYRQAISELLLEKFTAPWHDWAGKQKKLIRNQSHGSPANILDLYAAIDIPETEGDDMLRYKFATSAAHVTGKPLASSESATWLDEHFQSSLGDVKQAVDKFFIGGVNHIFYHGVNYSPKGEAWPGWLFYAATHFTPANPMWKDFGTLNQYVARTQSFLQRGKPDNDILVYYPFNDRNATPGKEMLHHFDGMKGFAGTVFDSASKYLLANGYSFDFISDKQLQSVNISGKRLETGGTSYQTILIPAVNYMPVETLEKLIDLSTNGANIIFIHHLPADVPGYGQLAERRQTFKEMMRQLHFIQTGPFKTAAVGAGTFVTGDDVRALLEAAPVRRERITDAGLHFVRRSREDGTIYFITNLQDKAYTGYLPLTVKAAGIALYDPMMGKTGLAKTRPGKDGLPEVFLALQPGESCILQTSANAIKSGLYPYVINKGTPQTIQGKWTLKFISGGPSLPASMTVTKPGSWTEQGDDILPYFSGIAEYSIDFRKPIANAKNWLLDLGKVGESAEVILNGNTIGTLLGPSYQMIVPAAAFNTNNHLQIRVTNSMANRIIYLEKNKVPWKKFYNINMPARFSKNRGADGLLDAAGWTPKPSGLLAPVTLTPLLNTNKPMVKNHLN